MLKEFIFCTVVIMMLMSLAVISCQRRKEWSLLALSYICLPFVILNTFYLYSVIYELLVNLNESITAELKFLLWSVISILSIGGYALFVTELGSLNRRLRKREG